MGGWIGNIDDTGLPVEMEVDYVRWYQNINNIDSTVNFEESEITLEEGEQEMLSPIITPEGADKIVRYESSDSTIASVDENGMVTGVKEGMAYITAVTQKGRAAACNPS